MIILSGILFFILASIIILLFVLYRNAKRIIEAQEGYIAYLQKTSDNYINKYFDLKGEYNTLNDKLKKYKP
jgi:predicted PurR-regulated permease PerM